MNPSCYPLLKIRKIASGAFVLALSGLLLLAGCSIHPSNYGKYQTSPEVGMMFESENLPHDYRYYYSGTFGEPHALIGLKPTYTLENELWTKIDPARLRQLMDNMWIYVGFSPLSGSRIMDPDGREIGCSYSRWSGGPIVMLSGDRVNIHQIETNDDSDRKD